MGYESSVEGEIDITPKLPHNLVEKLIAEGLAQKPEDKYYSGSRDAVVEYVKLRTPTGEGILVSYAGQYITCPWEGKHKSYTLIEDLQKIVDIIGEGFKYKGHLEINGEEDGDLWRLYIKNGKVVQVQPTIVWPEDL